MMSTLVQPTLSAIVAMSQNRVIGKNNQLPWHLPADLKHFKTLTTGNTILMGRKTYESIGKPLPNRTNIILTRDPHYQIAGGIVIHHFAEALPYVKSEDTQAPPELFIIGGAQLYQQLLPQVKYVYLTLIHRDFSGDTYFPILDKRYWKELECITHLADKANPYNYSFIKLERKQSPILQLI